MTGYITKDIFLNTFTCPTLGWKIYHDPSTEPLSLHDKFIIEEGIQIGRRARTLYPQGILVSGENISAAKTTAELLKDQNCSVIFEATFITDSFIAKADILLRQDNGWKVVEVKSATNKKTELVEDLAYTTLVAKKAGLKVSSCSLMLVSKDYRLGMNDEKLFEEVDCKDEVFKVVTEFEKLGPAVVALLRSNSMPNKSLESICKGCDLFKQCWGDSDNHIFDLPRLHHTKFCQLRDLKVSRIEDIPDSFELTDTQQKVRQAVLSGKAVIDKQGLKQALEKIVYPAYYLDFETVMTAIPLYPNIAPYTQIPTQYSIHKYSAPGKNEEHFEYLADPSGDCRRELAENLIRDCGNKGTIFSYSPFEKTVINGLGKLFPDLAEDLKKLVGRLEDLCKIISSYYYDPLFHGSFSIKKVLPVMITDPELNYDDMSVGNGSDAIAVFAGMAMGEYDKQECEQIRRDLLAYCRVDTLAMVKLYEELKD
ncbi:MAG: DUF2779 domain-containing protein [Planctomycetes bacterium]|nr:DUF2779 domain-containing protein [Planctomycetota bacterium]